MRQINLIESYTYQKVDRMPWGNMAPGVLYHSEHPSNYTGHICPCGCGDETPIPVNWPDDAKWTLAVDGDTPTISPSIWRRDGCQSHYFIKKGKVVWADEGED